MEKFTIEGAAGFDELGVERIGPEFFADAEEGEELDFGATANLVFGQCGRINREALEMAKAEETVGNDGELGLDEWGDEGLEFGAW